MKLDADQTIAEAASSHVHFDFSKLPSRDRYKLLIGTVIPRPIAFVTSVDEHGVVNAAPCHGYSRSGDQFDLPTMSVDEWRRRGGALPGRDGED
jgi:flavin reductase (DIM6/NTAB) family NADH-FMN oxidoreductase RutF